VKIGFLLNRDLDLKATQTTTRLIAEAASLGHEVVTFGVGDVSFVTDRVQAIARPVPPVADTGPDDIAALLRALPDAPQRPIDLHALDAIMVRTSPGRDTGRAEVHHTALDLLGWLAEQGVVVLNHPDGLRRASTKLYLTRLPPFVRPETVVSADPARLRAFVTGRRAPTVLKPLLGTRGQDVFMVEPSGGHNLDQIIDVLTRQGPAMAQAFIPEARQGDTRVILLDGRPLVIDGAAAAVRRVPGRGQFRSNVHLGGTPTLGVLTPAAERIAEAIGPTLRRDGLFLVGMDLIGDVIVELNVFSTGGLTDAERDTGAPFVRRIIDAVVERVERDRAAGRPADQIASSS